LWISLETLKFGEMRNIWDWFTQNLEAGEAELENSN